MDWQKEFADCLLYIDSYWDKIIFSPGRQVIHHHRIIIPRPFFTPNDRRFDYIFYWDSYFMFKGLIGTKRQWLLKNMVDNFVSLYDRYHIIPNFNSPAATGRSQPPFLTSMILDTYNASLTSNTIQDRINKLFNRIYENLTKSSWLDKALSGAKREYETVWGDSQGRYHHKVTGYLLNRYGDTDLGYGHSSELESGWDFTSRFYNRCDEFLPIDLNSYLFKYEKDFAFFARLFHNRKEERSWQEKADRRKREINRLMWNSDKGFFFDYGYAHKRQSEFLSLAAFTSLWAGLASPQQASRMVKMLPIFETKYGLVIGAKESLASPLALSKIPQRYRPAINAVLKPKQWDYPNIWPPLEYLTVMGLLQYGFINDAKRIMEKSIKAQARIFRKYGTFFEKIDGITGDKPKDFHYATQAGFGWTNAIFYRYIKILEDLDKR